MNVPIFLYGTYACCLLSLESYFKKYAPPGVVWSNRGFTVVGKDAVVYMSYVKKGSEGFY